MKYTACLALILALATSVYGKDERLDKLTPEHRKWLEEEVIYIITDTERDVFLQLETLAERASFIEAFWRKRDPNPATPENEFKIEHYRRIDHANQFLGRETFRPGWRTDRGRYYIILGEPREIQRFDGYNELVSAELWFMEGDTKKGLPSFFYLLFYKRHDIGEYELYHPIVDGPTALLRGQLGFANMADRGTVEQVMDKLTTISPELARASLSFDTSEPADMIGGRASLGTDIMLARVEDSPKRAINADYADAWMRYGKKVSAEYSFNFIPSRYYFSVLAGPQSTPFLNYGIEIDPQNVTMETDEDQTKYYTTLDISLEVRNLDGEIILANDKEVYLELSPSQVQQVGASPFSYQDNFPLLPGDYKVSVILRNRVMKQYTVAEQDVTVRPFSESKPALTDVVLGFRTEMKGGDMQPHELRTYQVGDLQIHPASDNTFVIGDTVHAFFQVVGAPPDWDLKFVLGQGEKTVEEKITKVADYQQGPVVERFHLAKMVGGTYELRVQLMDPSGTMVDEKSATVRVSPRSEIRRPWIYRSSFNTRTAGLLELARGDQYWRLKQHDKAQKEFEKAVAANNEQLPMARWKLAEAYIRSGKGQAGLDLLAPLEEQFPQQYEVIAGIGFSHYLLGNFEMAADYLARAMQIRPADTTLLNALGESFIKIGDAEKAKEALERSLAMDPNQQAAKDLLASIGTQ
jgi:GWxTD domain-containing protein